MLLGKEKINPQISLILGRTTIFCIWKLKSKSTSLTFSESMAENVLNSTSFLNRIFIICSIQSQTNKCHKDVHFYNNHKLVYSSTETLNASLTREATSALDTNPPIVLSSVKMPFPLGDCKNKHNLLYTNFNKKQWH